jgi:hypothetical protein
MMINLAREREREKRDLEREKWKKGALGIRSAALESEKKTVHSSLLHRSLLAT